MASIHLSSFSGGKKRSLRCHVSWPIAARMTRAALAEMLGLRWRLGGWKKQRYKFWSYSFWLKMNHLYYDRLSDVTEVAFKLRICLFHMQARSKWSAPSKHPTKRFRFFNHQGVLGLRIPGEFRVKAKLIGRVWIRLNQSNSKESLFLQQKPYHGWGHNLNIPMLIHFPYAFAEVFFFTPKVGPTLRVPQIWVFLLKVWSGLKIS